MRKRDELRHLRVAAARNAAGFARRIAPLFAGVAAVVTMFLPSMTETAVANGDTRTIYLYHAHTKESIAATYLVGGQYDPAVLQQLNWFLRDWRRDEPTNMDPRLFDVVWEAYRTAGVGTEVVNVVSAYRSPETNAMLRSRSRAVAKHSQHMLGKAMDTTMPGMPMSHIREIGMRMQRGGVGYYPNANTPFVHLDVGNVRSWPRMGYDQLARLFPDGKTVHLPTNGQPLARYEEARAEIEARNNGAYVTAPRRSGLFAFLFGGGEEDEDAGIAAPPPSTRKQWGALAPRGSKAQMAAAEVDEEGGAAPVEKPSRRGKSAEIARAEADLPRGETTLSPGPAQEMEPPPPAAAPAARVSTAPAPLPPSRPASIDKPTPLDVEPTDRRAAIASLGGAEPDAADLRKTLRGETSNALRAIAPLPPHRPGGLTATLTAAPGRAGAEATTAPGKKRGAPDALARLIDTTGAAKPAGGKARGASPDDRPMAYAPAARARETVVKPASAPQAAADVKPQSGGIGGLRSAARAATTR